MSMIFFMLAKGLETEDRRRKVCPMSDDGCPQTYPALWKELEMSNIQWRISNVELGSEMDIAFPFCLPIAIGSVSKWLINK